LGSLCNVPVLR